MVCVLADRSRLGRRMTTLAIASTGSTSFRANNGSTIPPHPISTTHVDDALWVDEEFSNILGHPLGRSNVWSLAVIFGLIGSMPFQSRSSLTISSCPGSIESEARSFRILSQVSGAAISIVGEPLDAPRRCFRSWSVQVLAG